MGGMQHVLQQLKYWEPIEQCCCGSLLVQQKQMIGISLASFMIAKLHDSQDTGDSRLNTKPMMGSAGRAVASELGIIHCARITRTEIEHLEHAFTGLYA